MKGKRLLAGGSAIILAVGAGALVWWRSQQPVEQPPALATPSAPAKSVSVPVPAFFGDEVTLTGTIQPQKTVAVAAPIDGTIQEVMADAGSQVFQGQVIARIRNGKLDTALESVTADTEKLKARISNLEASIIASRLESSRAAADALRAKSDLQAAERVYNRQALLYKEGATPRLTYEKSERDFKQAQTESDNLANVAKNAADRIDSLNTDLDSAKKLLEGRTGDLEAARQGVASGEVQAPADGLVIARKGQPGEQITKAVQDFFQIAVNIAALQAVVEADPAVRNRIKDGQKATVKVAEFPDETAAVVREVKGSTVFVEFASPSPEVKPGLTARVKIKLAPDGR